ncbi:MAG TPA: GtrA family protein [Geodermatophilus sp.]|nr:GtrA family protein [Geodermatophilus sp.]
MNPLSPTERTVVVTCPSLLRPAAAAEVLGDLTRRQAERMSGTTASLANWLRREETLAQFARFVLVGTAATVVYAVLFIALEREGYLAAHLVGTAISTALANEMHRRLTFRAEERVGWFTAQVEAGGITVLGLVATSAALGWLDSLTGAAPVLLQIGLVAAVTAFIGLMRFLALRWIFRPRQVRTA